LKIVVRVRQVAGIGADHELIQLLVFIRGLSRGPDGALLDWREILEFIAEIAPDRGLWGVGRDRSEDKTGEAERRREGAKMLGEHGSSDGCFRELQGTRLAD